MAKGKAADANGIILEMILCASDVFLQAVANMFTAILARKGLPPQAWKEALIKVVFNKRGARLPENYRPIC
eukprot:555597-Karenia_brevis.AAC.1